VRGPRARRRARTVQPRARRSASAGIGGDRDVRQRRRPPQELCAIALLLRIGRRCPGRLRGRQIGDTVFPRARAAPSAGLDSGTRLRAHPERPDRRIESPARSSRVAAHGLRNRAHGSKRRVPGPKNSAHGQKNEAHEAKHGTNGPRLSAPEPKHSTHGPKHTVHGRSTARTDRNTARLAKTQRARDETRRARAKTHRTRDEHSAHSRNTPRATETHCAQPNLPPLSPTTLRCRRSRRGHDG
jgi:hypothetical protein